MSEEDINYENILDELIEYKKLTGKLENELIFRENEISSIAKKCNNYKLIIDQLKEDKINLQKAISSLQQENNELIDRNHILSKHITDINNQHEEEIKSLKNINAISNNNISFNKDELNKKILELEKIKNTEISSLRQQIINLTKEKDDLELKLNYQNKKDFLYQNIDMNKNMNMNGNNVLNDIKNERNEMFQKIVKELRNQNALNVNNDIIIMLNENLKKVKEQYLKDIEKSEQNHLDEVKELKEKNMLLENKLNGLGNKLSYKDIQLIDIQKKIDEINITYKNLENKNTLLLDENNFLKKEKNDLRYSLEDLKDLLEKREEEFLYEKKKYEFTIKKLNEEINNYQDMLSNKEKEKMN
jgi:chromosome segregation ATPase